MAASTAIAKKASDAQKRIAEAGPQIAARLGVAWPTVVKSKDPALQRAREMEATANFLEDVNAALAEMGEGNAAPAEETAAASDEQNDQATEPAETAAATSTAPDAPQRPRTRRSTAKDR